MGNYEFKREVANIERKKQRIIQIVAITLTAVVIAVAVGLVFMFTKKDEATLNSYSREDTIQDITVYQTLYGENTETIATNVANAMNELSQLISFEEDDSDMQKLNQAAGLDWISLDPRTISILDKAEKVAQDSGGAFSPTIVPILNLWGFSGSNPSVPTQEKIEQFLPYVDHQNLRVDTQKNTASLKMRYSSVSLGGVYNGALCESAVSSYQTSGISAGIITIGNSVGVYGTKPDGSKWRLAIKNPDVTDTEQLAIGTFTIESGYASTYQLEQNSFVENGTTYYGILDPSTGKPVETDLVSVTVTHADGPTSDALSIACIILGKEKGMSLLEQYNAGGIFIDRENNVTVTDNLKESVQLTTDTFKLA